jgi:CheY-like chemotaxis protein
MCALRLLLVEDDYVINADLCGVLEDMGVSVTSVHTANDAVAALDTDEYLKALLTDIDLGVGLNGFDVARHGREVYPHLAVVYVSGTLISRYAAQGVAGSEFVAKPFHPREIRRALDRAVDLAA